MFDLILFATESFTCCDEVIGVVSAGVAALSSTLFSTVLFVVLSVDFGEVDESFEFVKAVSTAFLMSLLTSSDFDSFSLSTLFGVV